MALENDILPFRRKHDEAGVSQGNKSELSEGVYRHASEEELSRMDSLRSLGEKLWILPLLLACR